MTEGQLRDAVRTLDGSLDDVSREQVWRRVERAVIAEVPAKPDRRWRLTLAAVATGLAAIVLVVVLRPAREPEPALAIVRTELAAATGQQAIYERGGVTLTLTGPGAATVTEGDPRGLHVRVDRGTLVADRGATAPSIVVEAGGSTTTTRDARIAVRVQAGLVVFGAGEQARTVIERHEIIPPTPPAPPAPPAPTPKPGDRLPANDRVPAGDVQRQPTSTEPLPAPELGPAPEQPTTSLSADALYTGAEAALRAKDAVGASKLLHRLLAEYPDHTLVDAARYDLALITLGNGNKQTALIYARLVESGRDPSLRAAAATLRKRIERDSK